MLSTGDVNGDGADDVIVRAFRAEGYGRGAVVVFGVSANAAPTVDTGIADASDERPCSVRSAPYGTEGTTLSRTTVGEEGTIGTTRFVDGMA